MPNNVICKQLMTSAPLRGGYICGGSAGIRFSHLFPLKPLNMHKKNENFYMIELERNTTTLRQNFPVTAQYVKTTETYVGTSDRYVKTAETYVGTADRYVKAAETYVGTADRYVKTVETYVGTSDRYVKMAETYVGTADRYVVSLRVVCVT